MIEDTNLLRELESNRLAAREPSLVPDDYDDLAPSEMRPVDMAVIDRERDLLQRQGYARVLRSGDGSLQCTAA